MATSIYGSMMSSATTNINYLNQNTVYPPETDAVSVLGPLFIPSVYAKNLDRLEVGSSGAIAVGLLDSFAFNIKKKKTVSSSTLFQAVDAQPFEFAPGDASRTFVAGTLTISGSGAMTRDTTFANSANAYHFANLLDLSQHAGSGTKLVTANDLYVANPGTYFTDTAANNVAAFTSDPTHGNVMTIYNNVAANIAEIQALTDGATPVACPLVLKSSTLQVSDATSSVLNISKVNHVATYITAGDASNQLKLHLEPTDVARTVELGLATTYQSTMTDTNNVTSSFQAVDLLNPSADNQGFRFLQNVTLAPTTALYVNNLHPVPSATPNSIIMNSSVQIIGSLSVRDEINQTSINYLSVKDKNIILANGAITALDSSGAGLVISTLANNPTFEWNVGSTNVDHVAVQQAVITDDSYWKVTGGHLRIMGNDTEYGLRVNIRGELEIFKVIYVGGAPNMPIVVGRFGAIFSR